MSRRLRVLSMLLAVVLLAGVLVAFTPGDDPEAKAALGPLQAVTVTAANFRPDLDDRDYWNLGEYLYGSGFFTAPISFPAETVVITSVQVRVYDNRDYSNVCVSLYRARPGDAASDLLGSGCTTGMSTATPQTLTIPAVFTRVGRFHTAFLEVSLMETHTQYGLYGATVFYRVVS